MGVVAVAVNSGVSENHSPHLRGKSLGQVESACTVHPTHLEHDELLQILAETLSVVAEVGP